jgi:copper chaperone CopZ
MPVNTEQILLVVEGMSCGHCERTVEKGVGALPGVHEVKADHARNMVSIFVEPGTPVDPIKAKIRELGYRPVG